MDKSEINTTFFALIRDIDVPEDISKKDFGGLIEDTVSIDHVKDKLLNMLKEYLIGTGGSDVRHDENIDDTARDLTMCMNRYFKQIEGLSFNDEVIAEGDSIILIDNGTNISLEALPIPLDCQIVGALEGIEVTAIPTPESVPAIRGRSEQFIDEINPVPTIPFGLTLTLASPVVVSSDGSVQYIPEEYIVHIPLNYSQLQLKRLAL